MTGGKRKRRCDAIAEDKNENSNDELNSKVESLQRNVTVILGELQKLNETRKNEDNNDERTMMRVHDELEEMKNQQKLILEELRNSKNSEEEKKAEEEKKPSFNSVISPGSLVKNTSSNGMTPVTPGSFVLKHVFENVSKFEENKWQYSEVEEHFGVPWGIVIKKKKEQCFRFNLECLIPEEAAEYQQNWLIDTKFTLKLIGVDGNDTSTEMEFVFGYENGTSKPAGYGGSTDVSQWAELEKDYLIDDKLSTEIDVVIKKRVGIYKENLRCFDETMKKYSDVVLIVKNQKFYVLKLYLATHSSYFDSLFLGSFIESNKSEIELTGIEPEDFQNFLEVLYMKPAIDEITVEGILLVADMYDTSIVIGKCEEFLMEKSKKPMRKRLEMSIRYNLDNLKKKCLSEIKTVADIKSVISLEEKNVDPSIMVELLKKSFAFQ